MEAEHNPSPGVMPPEIRHESMQLLTAAHAACEAAQIALVKARIDGLWGLQASEYRINAEKALVQATMEIETLQLRAATTQRGTSL